MARVARRVEDKRVLKLIRRYLRAPISIDEELTYNRNPETGKLQGTPQGGPLSPILSNILLDDLDKKVEEQGHRICRYADDFIILTRSKRAAERVKDWVERYLRTELKLKVNESKSDVLRSDEVEFLGYGLTGERNPRLKVTAKALRRLRTGIEEIPEKIRRHRAEIERLPEEKREGRTQKTYLQSLSEKLSGWYGHYKLGEGVGLFKELKEEVLRIYLLTQLEIVDRVRQRGETAHEIVDDVLLSAERVFRACYPDIPYQQGLAGLLTSEVIDILHSELIRSFTPPRPSHGARRRGTT